MKKELDIVAGLQCYYDCKMKGQSCNENRNNDENGVDDIETSEITKKMMKSIHLNMRYCFLILSIIISTQIKYTGDICFDQRRHLSI